ncbi:MAG TPA: HIT domain-containing protein [Candidatus Bathyarchaeota archaeon]|nr:HIT domain-containing protein [Candidatus Bathyarchaeota archaeon]HEW89878.1 HIT domain-containing protein [Candidatus Bathyarchaeota archaeon]
MGHERAWPGCPFCRIATHEEPAAMIYEDGELMAFMDKNPVSPGHALVAPKEHHETIFDMEPELVGRLFSLAARVAKAIFVALRPDGLNLLQNNGPAAWQHVPHVHVHVIPRRLGDGIRVSWPARHKSLSELTEIAEEIKKHMG